MQFSKACDKPSLLKTGKMHSDLLKRGDKPKFIKMWRQTQIY